MAIRVRLLGTILESSERCEIDLLDVKTAEQFAREKHELQKDKNGDPYILHPIRVAAGLDDTDAKIVALLHDVLEDTQATVAELVALGVTERQLQALLLNHAKAEPYLSYLAKVRENSLALTVKMADLADNSNPERLARLPKEKGKELRLKHEGANAFLRE